MKILITSLVCALTIMLTSCGSGGGISGTGIVDYGDDLSIGTINGFGSVIVNQKRLNSDTATVVVNGTDATVNDLRIGMRVRTLANFETSTATRIEYAPLVIGLVTDIDLTDRRFSVLGHAIRYNTATRFDGISAEAISEGIALEVSGYITNNREIIATFIRSAANTDQFQVLATIDPLNNQFDISFDYTNLNFDLSTLQLDLENLLSDFDVFSPSQAIYTLPITSNSTFTQPTFSYLIPQVQLTTGAEVNLLQPVVSISGNNTFTTTDYRVITDQNTRLVFENGTAANLQAISPDQLLDIEGSILSGGRSLLATRVEILEVE